MSSTTSEQSGRSSPVSAEAAQDSGTNVDKLNGLDADVVAGKSIDEAPSTSSQPEGATPGPSSGATGGIDKLLQRHRNEIMFELRRLQLGERPVTGQGNKEAVESFFTRALNTGPNTEPSDQNRPEEVVVEVNALVERRPVSSLLQSSLFRRNLESSLRGALANLRPPASALQGARSNLRPASPTTRASTDTVPNNSHASPQGSQGTLPGPPGPQPAVRSRDVPEQSSQDREASIPQPAPVWQRPVPTPRWSATPRQTNTPIPHQQPAHASVHHNTRSNRTRESEEPRTMLPPATGPALAQQWLSHQAPTQPESRGAGMLQGVMPDWWDQAQRDDLIYDITELVHRQLVTSSLEGDFRGRLEHLMQERDREGGDRVAELIQSLPPRRVPRNDFSELGINNRAWSDPLDDVSVISATAAVTIPYAQSNAALSREMGAIKAQLAEMKNMMKMNFDVQLDIQRAIRQEVSGALHNVLSDMAQEESQASTSSMRSGAQTRSVPAGENCCLICLDHQVDSVLYQCGHMCVCYTCGMNLRTREAHCPVCRAPIRDIIRAYRCNGDV